MKTAHDPRHLRRIKAVKALFANTFNTPAEKESKLAEKVIKEQEKIDKIIKVCAPEWPLSQINRLDLSVLRLAIWEMLHKKETPPKVIIDEAIEIGKRYGSVSSGSFINGVLASALKETKRDIDLKAQEEAEKAEKKANEDKQPEESIEAKQE